MTELIIIVGLFVLFAVFATTVNLIKTRSLNERAKRELYNQGYEHGIKIANKTIKPLMEHIDKCVKCESTIKVCERITKELDTRDIYSILLDLKQEAQEQLDCIAKENLH